MNYLNAKNLYVCFLPYSYTDLKVSEGIAIKENMGYYRKIFQL